MVLQPYLALPLMTTGHAEHERQEAGLKDPSLVTVLSPLTSRCQGLSNVTSRSWRPIRRGRPSVSAYSSRLPSGVFWWISALGNRCPQLPDIQVKRSFELQLFGN